MSALVDVFGFSGTKWTAGRVFGVPNCRSFFSAATYQC